MEIYRCPITKAVNDWKFLFCIHLHGGARNGW